ncbi:pilus assembly protein PilM [Chloroflexota bacterium]
MQVTLNISPVSIRLLAAQGKQVKLWGEAPLEPGWVKDGQILETKAVGETIAQLLKSTGIPRDRVTVSLSNLPFTYRFLNLPKMKPSLQAEALRRAASREIPLPLEELYLAWQVIASRDNEQDFFLAGVSRNLIDAVVRTLAEAGLEAHIMDLKPLALVRAAGRENAIIVDMEADSFDIVIVTEGAPVIMHTVNPRGEGATIEENTRRLIDELSRTLDFHNSSNTDNPIDPATPLLLTGELSSDASVGDTVQTELGYPVAPLLPPLKTPAGLPVALYAANMGLVLKDTSPKNAGRFRDINLNILADKYRKVAIQPARLRNILLIAALIIVAGLLAPLYLAGITAGSETLILQEQMRQADRELNLKQLALERAQATEDNIHLINAEMEMVYTEHEDILSTRGQFIRTLTLVTDALPTAAYFTGIDIGQENIAVSGQVDNPFTVIDYATSLEALQSFTEVRIINIGEIIDTTAVDGEETVITTIITTFDIVIK